jgi:hypothetical protein
MHFIHRSVHVNVSTTLGAGFVLVNHAPQHQGNEPEISENTPKEKIASVDFSG